MASFVGDTGHRARRTAVVGDATHSAVRVQFSYNDTGYDLNLDLALSIFSPGAEINLNGGTVQVRSFYILQVGLQKMKGRPGTTTVYSTHDPRTAVVHTILE
jgi:hypothetical protein